MPGLDPNDPTVRQAVFGRQVEDFLSTEIGQFLLQRAVTQEEEAIEELIEAEPGQDQTEIRSRIRMARQFRSWLGEAVQAGLEAMELLREDEHG